MLIKVISVSYLFALFGLINCGVCPSTEVMFPCVCQSQEITCGGTEKINLMQIFQRISNSLKDTEKHFQFFTFNNTAVDVIEENSFMDITFIAVEFVDAVKLRKISPKAFSPANTQTMKTFHQHGMSNLGEDDQDLFDTFAALSSLVNVNEILFEINSFKSIPVHAFNNSQQTKVKTLLFNNDYNEKHTNLQIKSIEDYAFYYLNSVTKIYLWHQQINHISSHAFHFSQTSQNTLSVDLRYNQINDTSIEIGAFTNANRPLNINLYGNTLLTHINEAIFSPILSANSKNFINATGIEFECIDCRNRWLMKNRQQFNSQIVLNCKNGQSFWTVNDADFKCELF
jgi:hypothetical protein